MSFRLVMSAPGPGQQSLSTAESEEEDGAFELKGNKVVELERMATERNLSFKLVDGQFCLEPIPAEGKRSVTLQQVNPQFVAWQVKDGPRRVLKQGRWKTLQWSQFLAAVRGLCYENSILTNVAGARPKL